ncbi:hypothetical protein KJZ63_04740 [Patescibacteria group bacterium]|nr:hypothetical protein [Patescibacteria group bacterium]
MKNNTNQLQSFLTSTFNLVHQHPKIILASLTMSMVSLLGRMTDWPILSLVTSLILFGWGYVELDLLFQAQQNKKIKWNELLKKIFTYLKKTWPLIVIGLALLIFAFPILINLYLTYGSDKLQAIAGNNMGFFAFTSIIDVLTTILSLWFVQSMVILVVDGQPVLRSLKTAGQYLLKNTRFFLFMTAILTLVGFLSRTVIEFSPFMVATRIGYLLFSAYLGLLIKSTLLSNYLK